MRLFLSRMPPDTDEAALLRAASVDAERVVALLRIGVSLGLFLTLMMALDGAPEIGEQYLRRQVGLAMLTMASYFLLGIVTYLCVRFGVFRPWMVWITVTLDCLFVLANTGMSLLNSAVPGAVVFAMPSVWLVPVTLGFAVMRFNPPMMAYATVLIAAGIAAMSVWLPAEVAADLNVRIRATMAPQPNLVRVAMVLLGGLVLTVAALRTRALLYRSIQEARQKANLTRYLPAQLAGRLAGGGLETLREGRQVQMAVMFVDLCEFTRWCEGRDPQHVSALITDFRSRVQRAAEAAGGMIDKFIGDAAMILFEGPDAAARAVQCTVRLEEEMQGLKSAASRPGDAPLRAGIGAHYGAVFAGVVGTRERLEYSVFGDTVNIAARLEKLTRETGRPVVVSAALLEAAGAAPARDGWTALPPVGLRGRSAGVAIFGRGSFAG